MSTVSVGESRLSAGSFVRIAAAIGVAVACMVIAERVPAATLDEIKKRGYMIVATEDDYPPFEAVVNGKPTGYDHELLAVLRKSAPFEML